MNNEYYKKYLKYKTKYLELLKQSGGNANPQFISKSWYDLSDLKLFCTSDLEGGNPFNNLRSTGQYASLVTKELNNAFVINKDGNIVNLKCNTAFAFLGDLMDNNPFSIRLMQTMIKLKESKPRNVILLGGNRDFNKIRMGIELYIHTNNKILPWIGTNTIQDLLNRLKDTDFEFRHIGIPDYLKDVGTWDKVINEGKLESYNDNKNISGRLNAMYEFTLGIRSGITFMKTEIENMLDIDLLNYDRLVVDKLICTIHMVMAFDWCEDDLPKYLSQFNGLYQKYLSLCHVIAGFNMNNKNNNKIGILSHGSLPINTNDSKTKIDRTLTYPFGYNANDTLFKESQETKFARRNRKLGEPITPEGLEELRTEIAPKKSSLLNVISMIELEKNELIREYKELKSSTYNYDDFPMVTKFVHLTALTQDNNNNQANSTYSPVVWSQPYDISNLSDIKLRLSGESVSKFIGGAPGYGNWINNDKPKSHHIVENGDDNIHYNIFGHAPAYFNPIYNRENITLHVNLDVSKIESQSNSSSFAFLVINKNETKLMGRIKFPKIDSIKKDDDSINYVNNIGYNNEEIKKNISNHDHYYYETIKEGPVKLLKTDKIIGLDYKVTSIPGFNKLITN